MKEMLTGSTEGPEGPELSSVAVREQILQEGKVLEKLVTGSTWSEAC